MDMKKVFIVLVDISGYTKFIRLHKVSMVHAEGIISQLLESVMLAADSPLVAHELEGDSVTFYALSDGTPEMASGIAGQVIRFFEAFQAKEHELVSDCSLCVCDACSKVDRLKLKAVLHHGEAVFSTLGRFQKVSGEDMILAHRLLKNTIDSDEYILATTAFDDLSGGIGDFAPHVRREPVESFGEMDVVVYFPDGQVKTVAPVDRTLVQRLKMSMKLDGYMLKRLLVPSQRKYRHLDQLK